MKPVKTWIIVADGARARVFLNDGPGHGIRELSEYTLNNKLKPNRDINADRPGRTFDSDGDGRHAMEPSTDPNRHEKQLFVKKIIAMLEGEDHKKTFDRIVLVAAPQTLGDLRSALSENLTRKLTGELAKDLTQLNERALVGHLGDMLAV